MLECPRDSFHSPIAIAHRLIKKKNTEQRKLSRCQLVPAETALLSRDSQ